MFHLNIPHFIIHLFYNLTIYFMMDLHNLTYKNFHIKYFHLLSNFKYAFYLYKHNYKHLLYLII